MQENFQPTPPAEQPAPPSPQVGFPASAGPQPENKKKGVLKWVVAGVGVVVIIGAGVFFVMNSSTGDEAQATPAPEGNVLSTFPTPEVQATPEPTATPTPEPVDKTEVRIEILNGTGTAGEATFVKNELTSIEFDEDNIEAANADEQDETSTTVTYNKDVDQSLVDEIVAKLEESFSSVRSRRGTVSGDFDIRVLTGPRGTSADDATAAPEATDEPEE